MTTTHTGASFPMLLISNTTPAFTLAQADAAPPVAGRTDGGAVTGDAGQPLGGGGGPAPAPSPFGGGFIFILAAMFGVMILMQVFSGRKEKKRRAAMLSGLRRHDRVVTIGGLIGAVAEVRDDEVVLKIDESTNTKVRVTRSAIQSVLKRSAADERPETQPAQA